MGETVPAESELNHFGGVDRFLHDRVQRLRRGWITLADPPPLVCQFCDDFECARFVIPRHPVLQVQLCAASFPVESSVG